MNLIDKTLEKIRQEKRVGLMTHVVVGYPSIMATVDIVMAMAEAGADFVELQIPFSDPLADGPTIMRACEVALEQGTKVKDAFILAKKLSRKVEVPLLFMAYYNTVFKYGVEKFCRDARLSGISGLIVPDLPLEEDNQERLSEFAKKNDLHFIRVLAPASTKERLLKNAKVATGFIYCSSRQGITGVRKELPDNLSLYLKKVKKVFNVPVAVGFGISKPEHLKSIFPQADIAVVGSAILDVINKSAPKLIGGNVDRFVRILLGK